MAVAAAASSAAASAAAEAVNSSFMRAYSLVPSIIATSGGPTAPTAATATGSQGGQEDEICHDFEHGDLSSS